MRGELFVNAASETYIDFLLSGILTKERYPWFYENYINLCAYRNNHKQFYIEFFDVLNRTSELYYESKLITSSLQKEDDDEIIRKILSKLNENFYIFLWVDEYYIEDTESYLLYHRVHPIFLYGFNTQEEKFKCLQYSPIKGVIKLQCDYMSVCKAYRLVKDFQNQYIGLYPYNGDIIGYRDTNMCYVGGFRVSVFLRELNNYLFPNDTKNTNCVGIKVYSLFVEALKTDCKMEFRSIVVLYTHKIFLRERLIFIMNNFDVNNEYKEALNTYEEVIKLCKKLLFLTIKNNMREESYAGYFSSDFEFRKKIIDILVVIEEKEKASLNRIYYELLQFT